jgi:hypothetical protein
MDAIYIGLSLVFFAATYLLVRLCEHLRGER